MLLKKLAEENLVLEVNLPRVSKVLEFIQMSNQCKNVDVGICDAIITRFGNYNKVMIEKKLRVEFEYDGEKYSMIFNVHPVSSKKDDGKLHFAFYQESNIPNTFNYLYNLMQVDGWEKTKEPDKTEESDTSESETKDKEVPSENLDENQACKDSSLHDMTIQELTTNPYIIVEKMKDNKILITNSKTGEKQIIPGADDEYDGYAFIGLREINKDDSTIQVTTGKLNNILAAAEQLKTAGKQMQEKMKSEMAIKLINECIGRSMTDEEIDKVLKHIPKKSDLLQLE